MGAIYFNLSLFSGKYVKIEIKTEMYFSQVSVGSAFFDTFFLWKSIKLCACR